MSDLFTNFMHTPGFQATLAKAGFFIKDYSNSVAQPNQYWNEAGYTPSDLIDDAWIEFLHPEDKGRVSRLWAKVLSGQQDFFEAEYRIRDPMGHWHWMQNRGFVISRTAENKVAIYLGVDNEITNLKEELYNLNLTMQDMEQRYLQSETLRVAGTLVSSVLEVDKTVKMILEQAHQVVPFDTSAVCRYTDGRLDIIGGLGWEDLEKIKADICPPEGETPHFRVIQEQVPMILEDLGERYGDMINKNTKEFPAWLGVPLIFQRNMLGILEFRSRTPGFFQNDQIWPAMAFADNVAVALANARIYSDTKQEAHTDSLTGLFTRRFLFARGKDFFPRRNFQSSFISLIMMDIDHFKRVNDTFGHHAGDVVLKEVAALCRNTLRKSDVCCRYGGEEIAVLLPETDKKTALFIANRIRGLLEKHKFPELTIQVTSSFGVSSTEDHPSETLEELLEEADKALYLAKEKGRNRVETITGPYKLLQETP
ncbi:MAG: hypothetical protein A2Z96_04625 [Spirochaetes bacterium GWB1_48_6]|nr:MAG: hypothetical protein A2Z96_04625 [Spirochaetes bacterium GWB1_48_6]